MKLASIASLSSSSLVFALVVGLGACKNDPKTEGGETGATGTGEEGISTLSGDGDGDTTTTTTTGDGDGDGTTSAGDGDGEPASECGNGEVEPGEGCDDGNTEDGDGCSSTCAVEGPIECQGKVYACGDEVDNDDDGLVDLDDPECISPCDDDESTFKTNLPGQNNDCKGDCYFDSNSGAGDDKCEWNLQCDPGNPGAEIGCEYDPNAMGCDVELPQACLDFCTPAVPNGCDCFGCCEVEGQFVYLDGAACSLDNLDGCQSCTFFEDCNNPCEPELCELCFGQTIEDLPEECDEPACPEMFDPCEGTEDCQEAFYCLTGCCVPVSIG